MFKPSLSNDDVEIINYVEENEIPFFLVVTKFDKVNQKEKAALNKHLKEVGLKSEEIFYTSALKDNTLTLLKKGIEKSL